MNAKQLSKVARKLAKWDANSFPSNDNEILTIELDYPYYLVVKYGAAILHEIVSNEDEGILGEQRCKEIAIVDFDGNFNSYQYLQLRELEVMYNILHEYKKAKKQLMVVEDAVSEFNKTSPWWYVTGAKNE